MPRFQSPLHVTSLAASALVMAVAHAAWADVPSSTTVVSGAANNTYTLSTTPAATIDPNYSNATLYANAAGNLVLNEQNFSTGYYQPFYFSAAGAAGVPVGPISTDYAYIDSQGFTVYQGNFSALGASGAVLGTVRRSGNTTSLTMYGQDAYLHLASSGANNDTILNSQGILGAVNSTGTLDGSVYYYYNTGSASPIYRSGSASAVNASNQVIGVSARYTGTTSTLSLGQDAWIYTPAATTPITLVGLTGYADSYTSNMTLNSSTVMYSAHTSSAVALNSNGSVVGTSTRYQSSATVSANGTAGQDAWLYTPASGTVQIGLTGGQAALGGYYSTALSGSFTSYTQNYSNVTGISNSGSVIGTALIYSANGAYSSVGTEAWLFTPGTLSSGTPATASGYGTTTVGTYTQLGLTASGTASTAPTPVVGYESSSLNRYSFLTAISPAGDVIGASQRFYMDSGSAALGQDAWYYSAKSGTTTRISASSSTYSNYVQASGYSYGSAVSINNSGMTTGTQARYSPAGTPAGQDAWVYDSAKNTTYVVASPSLIATFSDFSSVASDANSSEYFYALPKGVTDSGLAYGYFTAYTGTSSSGPQIGTYIYAWTEATGTMILTSTASSASVDPLSNAEWTSLLTSSLFADSSGNLYGLGTETNGSLGAFELKPPALLLGDANGDGRVDLSDLNIVLNHLGVTDSARADGNFDGAATIDLTDLNDVLNNLGTTSGGNNALVSSAPEPASLSLLGAAGILMLRRRRVSKIG